MSNVFSSIMEKYGDGAIAVVDARFDVSEKHRHEINEKNVRANIIDCIRASEIISLNDYLKE